MSQELVNNLIGNLDSQSWAKEFVRIVKTNPAMALDEECMTGWFANSFMTGYDFAQAKIRQNNTSQE